MKNAILVHGWVGREEYYDTQYPTASNSHWFPWLTKQLMVRDIYTVAPEMPNSYYPDYFVWKREFERFDIGTETTLVGHSCGGGFLVRWLSESDKKVDKVILVAPWIGYDAKSDEIDDTFFNFKIDSNLHKKCSELIIINSADDKASIQRSVSNLKKNLDRVKYVEFESKGHFTKSSMHTEEFPELLEEILN